MVKIRYRYHGILNEIYAKLEYYNLTGSIKDRIAEHIITKAKREGKLQKHMPIVEATSGNTGISFAALGAREHHPVIIFMPDWVSPERVKLMQSYGAVVHLISKEDGGFQTCIQKADQLSLEIGGFRPNQFSNQYNIDAHYLHTGKEIIKQISKPIGGFTSGIGTGGTFMGVGTCLKEVYPKMKLVALEPKELPIMSQGVTEGKHKIEGIGDDFIPDLVDMDLMDDIYLIESSEACDVARLLSKQLGLGVGISSGANFLSAIRLKDTVPDAVVTIFPDDQKKYLSTELGTPLKNVSECNLALELLSYEVV